MAVERILGTETGKAALEKTDRNVAALDASLVAHKAESASKHIKESGANANGSYIKFDDGTMICYNLNPKFDTLANATTTVVWNFPATFTSVGFVGATMRTSYATQADRFRTGTFGASLTNRSFVAKEMSGATFTDIEMYTFAIGRWKA